METTFAEAEARVDRRSPRTDQTVFLHQLLQGLFDCGTRFYLRVHGLRQLVRELCRS